MTSRARILIAAVVALSGFTIGSDSGPMVVGGTAEDHAAVAWAVERLEQAGLDAPPIAIEFHEESSGCDGADGRFRASQDPVRIDICTPHRLIILHELVHAWDHFTLTDVVRADFMELRNLSVWNDHAVPWSERGVEDLAEIVTWGIHENPIGGHDAEKEAAFRLVTGLAPRHLETEPLPARTSVEDPTEAEPDWDTVR